ncbi:MAG TPA: aconitate hydratase [Sphaerochaeta sp.]|nr:aconitate hydratase [Sphaerochaeta sp.]
MGKNLTEKILSAHLMEGSLEKGNPIGIRIDQTLTQDATGTMAYLQFEAMGLPRVKNELAVSYVDHNTIQVGFENADDHRYLQSIAASKGVIYSRPGNGICHQVHLERFGKPGATLLGSDSHTPTGGGLGMIAIGSGGLDVAVAMAGGAFHLIAPKVVEIRLTGKLRPWISAKDVILAVLEHFTTKGNVNCIFEYTGEGVATLEVPERSTICNMGAEAGVTTSLFPSDENTRRFLKGHNRVEVYTPLAADADATYDDLFEIDLSTLEARIALPHSPDNIVLVKDVAGKKVDQVLIGSCTNSSYVDMKKVADLLSGKVVHPSVSLGVAPGSREVFMMLANDGSLAKLIASGARILESACGFCIGNHQSPGSGEVSLRTNNRNFEGRSGTKSGQVYLVSPEVAALGALTGVITDPLSAHGFAYPKVTVPSKFLVDDSMLIFPPKDGSSVQIFRGPNIGDPPKNTALTEEVKGVVTLKVGDKITTDHIMPAGARLKYRSNIVEYSKYVFEPVDPSFADRCQENQKKGKANFIVAGSSYGQGSSREHAAICPMYLGVQAVIALSIERIHQNNLCNFGIIPLTFKDGGDYEKIEQGDELVLEDIRTQIGKRDVILLNKSQGLSIPLVCDITDEQHAMLLAGGLLNVLKEKE